MEARGISEQILLFVDEFPMVQWGKSTEWLLKFHPGRDHATRKIISGRQISLHFPRIRIFLCCGKARITTRCLIKHAPLCIR